MNVEGTLCVLQDIHISLVHNVMAKVTLRQTKSLSVPLIKISIAGLNFYVLEESYKFGISPIFKR